MNLINQINIILSGVGGQGIIKAGQLIGNAVAAAGKNVVMSEIHGMSQRGGVVDVDLRIGRVYGPIIPNGMADLFIGFEASEALRAMKRLSKNTVIITSAERIIPTSVTLGDYAYPDVERITERLKKTGATIYAIDAQGLAGKAGSILSTNTVLVGAAYASGFIPAPLSILKDAVRQVLPERSWDANLKALELGIQEFRSMSNHRYIPMVSFST